MLAQNFKSPTDLRINDAEFEALVKVLGILERLEVKGIPNSARALRDQETIEAPTLFSMMLTRARMDCGTSCCILGFARHVGGEDLFYDAANRPCADLFYPQNEGIQCRDPEKGAIALRNYLTCGVPRWAEVMAE